MKRGTAAASLALAVLVGGALRARHLQGVGERYAPRIDAEEGYYEAGLGQLSCHRLARIPDAAPTDFLPPLYPSFFALTESFFARPSPYHARLAKALLSTLAVAAAGLLGWRLFSPLAGVFAGALLALNPGDVLAVTKLNIHAFYGTSLLALGIALVLWLEKRDGLRAALLGLMIAATLLCRPAHFPFPLLLAAACLWRWKFPEGARRALLPVAAAAALFLAPMAVRNGLQFGAWWPFDNKGSIILMHSAVGPHVETGLGEALADAEAVAPGFKARGLSGRALDQELIRLALVQIARSPWRYAGYCLQRFFTYWSGLWLYLVLGAYALWRRRGDRALEALVLTAASLSGYAFAGGASQYRASAVPLLCVIAGAGLARIPALGSAPAESAALKRRLSGAVALLPAAFAAVYAAMLVFLALELRDNPVRGARASASPCSDGRALHALKLASMQAGGRGEEARLYAERAAAALDAERGGGEARRLRALVGGLLRMSPEDAGLRLLRAELDALTGDVAAALEALARAEGSKSLTGEQRGRIIALHLKLGGERSALAAAKRLLGRWPRDAGLWLERAGLEAASGDESGALRSLARVEAAGPDGGERRSIAGTYRRLGAFRRALAALEPALRSAPRDAGLWLERAELEAELGERDAALASLGRAEAEAPDDGELRRAAALYGRLKEPGRALAAQPKEPPDAGAWLERATLEARAGDRPAALASAAKAEGAATDEQRRRIYELYRELKEPRRASAALEPLLRSRPRDAGLWLERAEVETLLGRRDAALEALARAEGSGSPDESGLRRAVELYRELKEPRRPISTLKTLLRGRPRDAGLWLELAEFEARAGELDAARASAERAERLGAASDDHRRRLAGVLRDLKEDRRALAQLRLLLERRPRDAELWLERAELEARAGERDAALGSLARAERLDTGGEARRRVAALYRRFKDFRRALTALKPLLAARPGDAGLLLEAAELATEMNDKSAALASLSRAEREDGGDDARARMVLLYRRLGEPGRALALLEPLLERRPGDAGLWLERAELEAAAKDKAAALASLARAREAKPDAETLRRAALDYQGLGEHARAIAVLDELIRLAPEDGTLLADRGLCRYLKGDAAGAIADLEAAIRLAPKSLPAYLSLGAVHAARGDSARALKVYDEGLARAGGDAPLRGELAREREAILAKGGR